MPQTCPQCERDVADDAAFCPSCGTALRATSETQDTPAVDTPATSAAGPSGATAGAVVVPPYKFDAAR